MVFARLALFLFLVGVSGCVGGGGGPVSPALLDPSASIDTLLARYRAERGLGRLVQDSRLNAAAARHARDLAQHNRLSHSGSDGSDHIARAEAAGYGPFVAENVAAGQKSPAEVMQAWAGSSGHRANLNLNPATHYGFAHAVAADTKYRHFWVLMVGRPQGDAVAKVNRVPGAGTAAWLGGQLDALSGISIFE